MNKLTKEQEEIFNVWKEYGHEGDFEACMDSYQGEYKNLYEFGAEMMESCYDIPEHLASYIDYEKFGRDLIMGGDYWTNKKHYFSNH